MGNDILQVIIGGIIGAAAGGIASAIFKNLKAMLFLAVVFAIIGVFVAVRYDISLP